MKKIFLFVFIAGLCVSFKPKGGIDDFLGKWNCVYYSPDNSELPDFDFDLFLTKSGNKRKPIKGWYCSVMLYGNRIDCPDPDEDQYNIEGYYAKDTIYITFTDFYYPESTGTAKIYKKDKNLIWELGPCKGPVFVPQKAVLTAAVDTTFKNKL